MRIRNKIIFSWLFFMIIYPVAAQQYKAVLPYRVIGGKMIVDMVMNGTPRSFIFDTGVRL